MALRFKKDEKNVDVQEQTIDVDAAMQGSLIFKEPVHLRIKGKFEGTLEVKGTLMIGEQAFVNAKIKGENVIVAGRLKGDIDASVKVELLEQAVVEGHIKTPKLSIQEGAIFHGTCVMLEDILTTEEVAKLLELDVNTVVNWVNSGKIPAFRDVDEWKFEKNKIDAWVSSGKI